MSKKKAKRKYGKLDDAQILKLILDGVLIVDVVNALVYNQRVPSKPIFMDVCHRGYRHVRIFWKNRRRSVALHKLVWMAANRQVVPDGYHIDHQGLGQEVNGIHNLLAKDGVEHGWYHEWKRFYQHEFSTYDEFRVYKRGGTSDSFT